MFLNLPQEERMKELERKKWDGRNKLETEVRENKGVKNMGREFQNTRGNFEL